MMAEMSGPRPSDRFIPWYIVGFFVVLTMVLGTLVWIAEQNFPGTVTDKPYERGLAYNRTLQAAAAEQAMGWHGKVTLQPVADGYRVRYELHGADGLPLPAATVQCWLYRPSNSKLDQKFALTVQPDGSYAAPVTLPAKGVWEIRLAANAGGHDFQQSERIVVQ